MKVKNQYLKVLEYLHLSFNKWQRYLMAIRTYFTRWLIRTNSYDFTRTI